MVGATGFEPEYGAGQTENTPGTKPGHTEVSACGQMGEEGQTGDDVEHPEHTVDEAPCCTYVADPDFASLVRVWQAAPQWAREVCTRVLKEAGNEDSRRQGAGE
jgi:hypothetical protein